MNLDLSTLTDSPVNGKSAPSAPKLSTIPDQEFLLPNGTPLLFSLMVEAHMNAVFAGESVWLSGISTPYQAYVFLWMCAHPKQEGKPALWEVPGVSMTGDVLPLYLRLNDLINTALDWFSANFPVGDTPGMMILANHLWNHHKGAEVVPDPNPENGAVPEKKSPPEPTPTPLIKSSTSFPEETCSCGNTSSTGCPCGKPSPHGTATCSPSDSPVSAPANSPDAESPPETA